MRHLLLGRSCVRPSRSVAGLAVALAATVASQVLITGADASEEYAVEIKIKDHKFEPAEVTLPSGRPIKISVKNLDASAEEFESRDLGFEKVIAGNSGATIRVKPLKSGNYVFFGEYHEDTALGHIVAQ